MDSGKYAVKLNTHLHATNLIKIMDITSYPTTKEFSVPAPTNH